MAPLGLKTPEEVWSQYVSNNPPLKPRIASLGYKHKDVNKTLKYFVLTSNDPKLQSNGLVKVMKYTVQTYGKQPETGYPLFIGLHGGGKNDENDNAWLSMSLSLYNDNVKDDIKVGVYIAVRGIVDDWNLHFRPESYPLLHRLFKNLFMRRPEEATDVPTANFSTAAQHFVDANKVYLAGFSAGGDGVYRLATTIPDRFAAVNMSAGHPGPYLKLHNLANLPICLQVGEEDGDSRPYKNKNGELTKSDEYERNERTVETANVLTELKKKFQPNTYKFDMFMHPTTDKPFEWAHNSWESDELKDSDQSLVLKNWANFRNDHTTIKANTGAIKWVSSFRRTPYPPRLIWDFSTNPEWGAPITPSEWGGYRFFYWLAVKESDIAQAKLQLPNDAKTSTDSRDTIIVRFDGPNRVIWVEQTPVPLVIMLNSKMGFDLTQTVKPIFVLYGPNPQADPFWNAIYPQQYDQVQLDTCNVRGDQDFIFSSTILFDPKRSQPKDGGSQIFSMNRPSL